MEKNSLLGYRIGGQVEQVLSGEDALYVVSLGTSRRGPNWRRALNDPSEFVPGPGMLRIMRAQVASVLVTQDEMQCRILLTTAEGTEFVWHVNCRMSDEELRRIFAEVPLEITGAEEKGRRQHPSGLLDFAWTVMAILLPSLWWLRHSPLLFYANLLLLPVGLILLARGWCRFSLVKGFWLLPGLAIGLANARINLTEPMQIAAPAIAISLALVVMYIILHTGRRRWRRAAIVLAACLAMYAPGAVLGINMIQTETLRIAKVDPVTIQPGFVETLIDGETKRFYAHPDVCETLSMVRWCELRLYRGMLGIEYWAVMPDWQKGLV